MYTHRAAVCLYVPSIHPHREQVRLQKSNLKDRKKTKWESLPDKRPEQVPETVEYGNASLFNYRSKNFPNITASVKSLESDISKKMEWDQMGNKKHLWRGKRDLWILLLFTLDCDPSFTVARSRHLTPLMYTVWPDEKSLPETGCNWQDSTVSNQWIQLLWRNLPERAGGTHANKPRS